MKPPVPCHPMLMLQDEKAKEVKDKEKAKDGKEAKDGKDKDGAPGSRQASEPPAEPANAKADTADKAPDAGKDTGKDALKDKEPEGGPDAAKDKDQSQPQADGSAAAATGHAAGDAAADTSAAASPVAAAPLPSVPLPEEPGLQLRGRAGPGCERVKTVSLSLHGLLEYDETDRDEPTFELSVFAECVQDMLVREYGMAVYRGLLADRWVGHYRRGVNPYGR